MKVKWVNFFTQKNERIYHQQIPYNGNTKREFVRQKKKDYHMNRQMQKWRRKAIKRWHF